MEAIGRLIDPVYVPNGSLATTWVSLKDVEACTILLVGASSTANATFTVAKTAAGGSSHNYDGTAAGGDGVTRYVIKTGSTGLWGSAVTQAAAATVPTTSGTGDITAIDIAGYQLPAGFYYIGVTHANANAVFVAHDLLVQRKPANLRSLIA
jgi:hypothetical protein